MAKNYNLCNKSLKYFWSCLKYSESKQKTKKIKLQSNPVYPESNNAETPQIEWVFLGT